MIPVRIKQRCVLVFDGAEHGFLVFVNLSSWKLPSLFKSIDESQNVNTFNHLVVLFLTTNKLHKICKNFDYVLGVNSICLLAKIL